MIFDLTINLKSELDKDLPTLEKFNSNSSLELVHDQDNADALRRQLIMSPATQEVTVHIPTDAPSPPVTLSDILTSDPHLPSNADIYNDDTIGTKYDEEGNIQYWYNMRYNMATVIHHLRNSAVLSLRPSIGKAPSFSVQLRYVTLVSLLHTTRL